MFRRFLFIGNQKLILVYDKIFFIFSHFLFIFSCFLYFFSYVNFRFYQYLLPKFLGISYYLYSRPFLADKGFVTRGFLRLSLLLPLLLALSASPAFGSGEHPPVVGAVAPHHNVAGALIDRLYERIREQIPYPTRVILIGPEL